MAKRASLIPRSPTTYNLSDDIVAKIGVLIYDPVTCKSKYGLKSMLVEELLEAFFKAHITGQDTINISRISKKVGK